MVLSDNNVLEVLKQANLLKENNYYFSSVIMPTAREQILLGNFSHFLKEFSGYIINYTDDGIGIIPLSTMTGNPMENLAYFLEKSNIQSVKFDKGGLFFYKKITITTKNNEVITFKVVKNVVVMKKYKENLQKFINDYAI